MANGATEAETPPEHSASVCWTCERASDPDFTLWVTLESFGPARDALGYQVTVNGIETTVSVPVPRCRACRRWFAWRQGIIVLSVFAGVFTPGVALIVYAHLTGMALPSDMFEGSAHYGALLIFFACIGLSLAAWWYGSLAILSLALGDHLPRALPAVDEHELVDPFAVSPFLHRPLSPQPFRTVVTHRPVRQAQIDWGLTERTT